MAKAKKELSLRQQMRTSAEHKLVVLMGEMEFAAKKVASRQAVSAEDLMGMLCKTQTNTLHDKLVTQLANQAENDLVKLWNDQQSLDLAENKDVD